jgi:hypothetical protein
MYGKKIIGLGGFNRTKKEARNLSKDIDLIFKHTMKDYRSNSEGIPKVLYFDKNKGTILSPIEKLPKKIFYERLKYAKQKEKTIGLGGVKSKKKKWPEQVFSYYPDEYKFVLEKVMSDRARYQVIDLATGKKELGGRVYGKPSDLIRSANDLIKPQGGTQSSNFGA